MITRDVTRGARERRGGADERGKSVAFVLVFMEFQLKMMKMLRSLKLQKRNPRPVGWMIPRSMNIAPALTSWL
jgi:hypothetical protein